MANLLSRLVQPHYPSTALGLEKGIASLVDLERARSGGARLRRVASIKLDESLIQPGFGPQNIIDESELATALHELAASAGLLKQKRWSICLPEETIRTAMITLEAQPDSNAELEEILTWKVERNFGLSVAELSLSREKLLPDSQGKPRYLIIATPNSILSEYESVFKALGWQAGLLQPRHMGEAQWLTRNGKQGDSLLMSTFKEGFTAVVFRDQVPLILRSISCDPEDCEDELYRLLLFYRDRRSSEGEQVLSRLLVLGEGFSKARAAEIANETLETDLRPLSAADLGLELPTNDIRFDDIAGPAGLATLSLN